MASDQRVLSLAQINPAWLTDVLRSRGAIDGAVLSVDREPISSAAGFVATLTRLRLALTDPLPEPLTLVAKVAPADEGTRRFMALWSANEVRFYAEVAATAGIPTPHVFFAAADEASGDALILLEDLRHYAWPSPFDGGCTHEQAQLAIERLAAFHARRWGTTALQTVPWVPTFMEDADVSGSRFRSAWERLCAHNPEIIPPLAATLGERLYRSFPSIYAAVLKEATRTRLTLCHGDYRLGNIAFAASPLDPPIKVIDWSQIRRGRGPTDLVYFLVSPGSMALADALVNHYYQTLEAHGVADYSYKQFRHDLQIAMLQVFCFVVTALGHIVIGRTPAADQTIAFVLGRWAELAEGHRLLDLVD